MQPSHAERKERQAKTHTQQPLMDTLRTYSRYHTSRGQNTEVNLSDLTDLNLSKTRKESHNWCAWRRLDRFSDFSPFNRAGDITYKEGENFPSRVGFRLGTYRTYLRSQLLRFCRFPTSFFLSSADEAISSICRFFGSSDRASSVQDRVQWLI